MTLGCVAETHSADTMPCSWNAAQDVTAANVQVSGHKQNSYNSMRHAG